MSNHSPVVLDARVLSGSGGGPDKTLINSPRFLDRDGYTMKCVYLHHPEDPGFSVLQKKAAAKGVELLSVVDRGLKDWRVIPRLLEICKREQVDIWHGHDYKTNLLGLMLRRFYRMRLVTTAHGWVHHTAKTPLYYWLDKRSLRYYEKVYCVSQDLVDECIRNHVPKDRCVLLENGIDIQDYARTKSIEDAKAELGLPRNCKVIGAVGRLSKEKGFDLLLNAIKQLHQVGIAAHLLLVGEGDEKANLQQQLINLQLQQYVHLLGYRSDLHTLYQAMDVYALSSYREGLPNVLLEAMALEVPVVATAVNGVPRLIQHEHSGLLIPPGNVQPLAEAIQRLLHQPELANTLQRNARQTIEQRYDFAVRMRKLRESYDEILSRKHHAEPLLVGSAV